MGYKTWNEQLTVQKKYGQRNDMYEGDKCKH